MADFDIVPLTEEDADRVRQFTQDHRGADFVVLEMPLNAD